MQQDQDVLIFGELLIRLSSVEDNFLSGGYQAAIYPGGSEANVTASLAKWKIPVTYITACPENALSKSALDNLATRGADVSKSLLQGSRIGLYFLLSPNGLSSGEVVYDRKYSSFSKLMPGEIDWDNLMNGKRWFHWSALTPALNEDLAMVIEEALIAARKNGLTVSVDLNYRNRLWDYGKNPIEIMPKLAQYCDVIMGNIWAAEKMLGTEIDEHLGRHTSPEAYFEHSTRTAKAIFEAYPNCKHVANTFRFMDNPKHNLFYGAYHNQQGNFLSSILETNEVIDRIGSGDAFMAGLIYGLNTNADGQAIIETATRAGYQKLFDRGDFGNGNF
ncbi:MAG: sugar kinase [Bacteroidota bacterium]